MNSYTNSRFGRAPVGSMATSVSNTGPSVAASGGINVSVGGGDGAGPTLFTLMAAIGFLVVFYWGTRRIQGLR